MMGIHSKLGGEGPWPLSPLLTSDWSTSDILRISTSIGPLSRNALLFCPAQLWMGELFDSFGPFKLRLRTLVNSECVVPHPKCLSSGPKQPFRWHEVGVWFRSKSRAILSCIHELRLNLRVAHRTRFLHRRLVKGGVSYLHLTTPANLQLSHYLVPRHPCVSAIMTAS